jgi:hypothetical protein
MRGADSTGIAPDRCFSRERIASTSPQSGAAEPTNDSIRIRFGYLF